MRRLKVLVLSLAAALFCCACVAANASAEGGPLIGFCEEVAVNGGHWQDAHCENFGTGNFEEFLLNSPKETLLVLVLSLNTQVLKSAASADTVECLKFHVHGWVAGGSPATERETATYTGCKVVSPHEGCEVSSPGQPNGTINTNELASELVYLEETAAKELNPDKAGTLFKPATGTVFAELELKTGTTTCPISGTPKVNGEAIAENDEALTRILLRSRLFPTTSIKKYFAGMTGASTTIKPLEFAGVTATYLGKISVDVSLLKQFGKWLDWWLCP
jgi:hypothetical protein